MNLYKTIRALHIEWQSRTHDTFTTGVSQHLVAICKYPESLMKSDRNGVCRVKTAVFVRVVDSENIHWHRLGQTSKTPFSENVQDNVSELHVMVIIPSRHPTLASS